MSIKLLLTYVIFKASLLVAVTTTLDLVFWKSLIIAVVSGGLGAVGAIFAAYVAVRETQKTRDQVIDIKRKIGADRRKEDPPNPC